MADNRQSRKGCSFKGHSPPRARKVPQYRKSDFILPRLQIGRNIKRIIVPD
jgi:hypothetical protein